MRLVALGLQIIGVLTLLFLVVLTGFIAVFLLTRTAERVDKAGPADVVHVLNWGGIDPQQELSVIYSEQSQWNPMGDHVDFYCIQIERFPERSGMWRRSGHSDEFRSKARTTAAEMGGLARCFGSRLDGNPDSLIARVHRFNVYDNQVQGAVVTFFHEETMRLLHVSYQF